MLVCTIELNDQSNIYLVSLQVPLWYNLYILIRRFGLLHCFAAHVPTYLEIVNCCCQEHSLIFTLQPFKMTKIRNIRHNTMMILLHLARPRISEPVLWNVLTLNKIPWETDYMNEGNSPFCYGTYLVQKALTHSVAVKTGQELLITTITTTKMAQVMCKTRVRFITCSF